MVVFVTPATLPSVQDGLKRKNVAENCTEILNCQQPLRQHTVIVSTECPVYPRRWVHMISNTTPCVYIEGSRQSQHGGVCCNKRLLHCVQQSCSMCHSCRIILPHGRVWPCFGSYSCFFLQELLCIEPTSPLVGNAVLGMLDMLSRDYNQV